MTVSPDELKSMRDAQEEVTMPDLCRIERRTRGAYNETTYKHSETTTTIYEGVCEFALIEDNNPEFGGAIRLERLWRLSVPYDVIGVKENDVAVVVMARDPLLGGVVEELNITTIEGGGFATRRQFSCGEVS